MTYSVVVPNMSEIGRQTMKVIVRRIGILLVVLVDLIRICQTNRSASVVRLQIKIKIDHHNHIVLWIKMSIVVKLSG